MPHQEVAREGRIERLFHEVANLPPESRERHFADRNAGPLTRSEAEALIGRSLGQAALRTLESAEPKDLPCGPYRLVSLLGRGGMGSVYLADRADGEVSQQVAVKLLQPGAEGPRMLQRFLAERQILASLSHPGIARLLDAGHREDGQPYLVMEYVRGTTIDAFACALGIREKLKLFLKVCAAVSYLHRNLVVHRDLKPANILVTGEGEPKLLDFGIAMILDLARDHTTTGMRMLTPDFASPEQVTGSPITTASDIYSLGAVLYKLLTGASPHQFEDGSAAGVAAAITGGRIRRPGNLLRALRGDLEVILLKALRKEPQERYATVERLAEDLENYLESRPIRARKGDTWYRARKFVERYWLPVAAGALAVGGLAAGVLVANHETSIAERRFHQLRQLSNRVIDLDRALRTLPGSAEARQGLVAASLRYLEGLSRDARTDLDLAQDLADGYWRLARILGVNTEFNLGDSAKAEKNLEKADALIHTVLAARPLDRNALFRSALIAHDRMLLAQEEDRRQDALNLAATAAALLQDFLAREDAGKPVRLDYFFRPGAARQSERVEVAKLYINIAQVHINLRSYAEGERYAGMGVGIAQSVPSAEDVVCQALAMLAYAQRYQGRLDSALETIRRAEALLEKARFPNESASLFTRFGVLMREGRVLGEVDGVNLGRPEEAIGCLQKAVDIVEEAARGDRSDSASRTRVANGARELGDLLRDRDPRRALAVYDLGIRRLQEAQRGLGARRDRAVLLALSAAPLRRLHRAAEAKARLDDALAMLRETGDYPAERIDLESRTLIAMTALARHEAETGNPRRALEIYQELFRKVAATRPEPETSLPDASCMSGLYRDTARLYRQTGQSSEAAALEARRIELWRYWDSRMPNNGFVSRQLESARAVAATRGLGRALGVTGSAALARRRFSASNPV